MIACLLLLCLAIWKNPDGGPIEVAVKRLKDVTEKAKEDMFNEAFNMKDLCHPNIVRLYGVVSSGEPYCMVAELVRDGSLKVYLQQRRLIRLPPLPDLDLIDISTQVRVQLYILYMMDHQEVPGLSVTMLNMPLNCRNNQSNYPRRSALSSGILLSFGREAVFTTFSKVSI